MPVVPEEDLCRWRQLSGFEASSSDEGAGDCEEPTLGVQHISRIIFEGDTFYHSLRNSRRLAIQHEAEKASCSL